MFQATTLSICYIIFSPLSVFVCLSVPLCLSASVSLCLPVTVSVSFCRIHCKHKCTHSLTSSSQQFMRRLIPSSSELLFTGIHHDIHCCHKNTVHQELRRLKPPFSELHSDLRTEARQYNHI